MTTDEFVEWLALPGKDRSEPAVFAGRAAEIAWLDGMLRLAKLGGEGLSCVVHGVPGTGKTSLVRRFCRDAEAAGAVAARLVGRRFWRTDELAAALADRFRRIHPEGAQAAVGFHADGATAPVGSGPMVDPSASLAWHLNAIRFPRDVPIIVFVDEAHTLDGRSNDLAAELQGGVDGRAILPVYAGLSRAVDVVEDLCQSAGRLARHAAREIGPLSVDEARASIAGVCARIPMDADIAVPLAAALADATEGFPAHIDAAVFAIGQIAMENGRVFPRDGAERCLLLAKENRAEYYEARLRSAGRPPLALLGALARASGSSRRWIPCVDVRNEYESAATTLPQGRDLPMEQLVARCAAAGVLRVRTRRPDLADEFQFAAPSMAEHVLAGLSPRGFGGRADR